ncbi:MAG: GNAT family N-acetyltransferase [Pseudomonadota bacterium]
MASPCPDNWALLHPIPPEWEQRVGAFSARRRVSLKRAIGDAGMREDLLGSPIRRDRICAAISGDEVIGVLSYRMDGAGAIRPDWARFSARFGLLEGTLRFLATQATLFRGRTHDLYIEGFAVSAEARGLGIGRALLDWLSAEVGRQGKAAWRTEMPETHADAARAYERFGARRIRSVPLGPAAWLVGSRRMILYRWSPEGG